MRHGPEGKVWLALGDVTGKGIGAAMLMASAMAGLQILEEDTVDPLTLVNRLHGHVRRHTETGQFITLFAGTLHPETGEIHYVNAGQNPPLVIRKDAEPRELVSTGVPVALLDEWEWGEAHAKLEPGETLIIFSDGVTETENTDKLQYDEVEDAGFFKFLKTAADLSPEDMGHKLLEDIRQFRGAAPIGDDLTLLIIRRL
jgi:serine phosphatase RsbU (regulator of sigma subunit)